METILKKSIPLKTGFEHKASNLFQQKIRLYY